MKGLSIDLLVMSVCFGLGPLVSIDGQQISASNEYGDSSQFGLGYAWLDGMLVVEPYKNTTLQAALNEATAEAAAAGETEYAWTITAPDGETSTHYGSEVIFAFEQSGSHEVAVNVTRGGSLVSSTSVLAYNVLVKREVRDLTDADRDKFLDTMRILWDIDTETGRKKYGSSYTGMDKFVAAHAYEASGNVLCDHFHEGNGFLVHHLALDYSFEMSLQTVDPSVTLPYWDFTIEGEKILKAGLGPSVISDISPMYTAEWFGTVDSNNHIVDSRWAHVSATRATDSKTPHNSWGFVRAPWNNNKEAEVSRHMGDVCGLEPVTETIPACEDHWEVMNLNSMADFGYDIAFGSHGPMHLVGGGTFGECTGSLDQVYNAYPEVMSQKWTMKEMNAAVLNATGEDLGWTSDAEFTMGNAILKYIHLNTFIIYRDLWRSQSCAMDEKSFAMTCPDSCSDDDDLTCNCVCNGIDPVTLDSTNFDWMNLEGCLYVGATDVVDVYKTAMPEEMRKDLITAYCSTGLLAGENIESASPGDPVFWMIHPALDRLFTAKRLASNYTGLSFGEYGSITPFTNTTWVSYSDHSTLGYICEGHAANDEVLPNLPLPPSLIELGDDNGDGVLSNEEFTWAIDPNDEAGTLYIYDKFEWSHCTGDDDTTDDSTDDEDSTEADYFTFDVKPIRSGLSW